ncbi:related to ATPase inhibitor, mitochondrial precursor [Ustilago trichophora]|uniref:ATPase inhibitor, mitochondrial n=1 Tax=Ustilago trichophora TaxID=86804 RepID=A0A5C3ENR8_9BASI|nr:related to ATPase inhibitor, mitochondrial precursor [Ustilago trichophora]
MSLLRVSTSSLARVSKTPTFVMATRGYADGPTEKAGATASSKGWSKREQAQENQYVQQAEKEKLAKLRESIKKQREHLDEVESHLNNLDKK